MDDDSGDLSTWGICISRTSWLALVLSAFTWEVVYFLEVCHRATECGLRQHDIWVKIGMFKGQQSWNQM